MNTYQAGQTYEFDVIDIRKDWGNNDYMAITDGEKEYKLYDIYQGQFENLPKKVFVRVTQVDVLGKIKIKQDFEQFNRNNYTVGAFKAFRVIEVAEDRNHKSYYKLEDDLATHSLYFTGDPKYKVGDDLILEIKGVTDKGYLMLAEHKGAAPMPEAQPSMAANAKPLANVLDLGPENDTLELKTSIVFSAGGHNVIDVNGQVTVILKELISFMNAKGGKLYIGVHDETHQVTGIENDYPHLEEDPSDSYSYSANSDGFELKIRNMLGKRSQGVANSLITFEFPSLGGHEYCIITVEPAKRPIWLDGTQLFQRVGNRMQRLKGDDINNFIYERMTVSITDRLDLSDLKSGVSIDEMKKAMQDVINERRPPVKLPDPVDDSGDVDYWIVWRKDATWCRQRAKSEDTDVYIQIPVKKSDKDDVLVFCYSGGTVNTVKLSDFKKGVNLNQMKKNGFYVNGSELPVNIFLAHQSCSLAGFSIDTNGLQYVKIHALTAFNPTASGKNKGSRFVPTPGKVFLYKIVKTADHHHVSHLCCKNNEGSTTFGIPQSSIPYKKEIEFISNL